LRSRLLNLENDLNQAAHALYQTDPFIFPYLFEKPEKANIGLTKLISLPVFMSIQVGSKD